MKEYNNNQDITVTELPQEEGKQTDGIRLTREEYDAIVKRLRLPNWFEQ